MALNQQGQILIFSYSPHNILSNKGEKLIKRCEIDTFQNYKKIDGNQKIKTGSAIFLYSENQFTCTVYNTVHSYEKVIKLLNRYKRKKESLRESFGVNLCDVKWEISFKEFIDFNLVSDFLMESERVKRECGCDWEELRMLVLENERIK